MPSSRSESLNMKRPWTLPADDVARRLDVSPKQGLTKDEVEKRIRQYGENNLSRAERESAWRILIRQFTSLIMAVLFSAVLLSFLFQQWTDGMAIFLAILINAGIGFVTELRALRTMESLQELDTKYVTVRREGRERSIDSRRLVPGDVVVMESGDVVAADMRVTEANNLTLDESALTGESTPVLKQTTHTPENTPLAERNSMVYKGTAVTEGSGEALAVFTGMDTEIGDVTSLVQEAESGQDPLDKHLSQLASRLIRYILVVALAAAGAGLFSGQKLFLMIETAVALFIAAVPEGLPIVSTVALARGMKRMVNQNALVRRLSAVQTLGSTTVIFTDKTGTLTENHMRVDSYHYPGRSVEWMENPANGISGFRDTETGDPVSVETDKGLHRLIMIGLLCNNASLSEEGVAGDPMEIALLEAGQAVDMTRDRFLADYEEIREAPFDPEQKMMATFHRSGNGIFEAVKGAPAQVLSSCNKIRKNDGVRDLDDREQNRWLDKNRSAAARGLRMLALAEKKPENESVEPFECLTFLGLVGLRDPVREGVARPVKDCREAGIDIVMVTGDQKETALAAGKELGIVENGHGVFHGSDLKPPEELDERQRSNFLAGRIFSRVGPRQKLDLIALHQQAGHIVAMTGDGVNDAPALKKADIGIAMGDRGQPVAEDAADIILQDDRFETIAMAVRQGRIIFDNIRNFVIYMISGNIGEILIVFLASIMGAPLPLLPLQILYINIVNDIFPAIALAVGPGGGNEMRRPPRAPDEGVMTPAQWRSSLVFGLIIAVPVLGTFAYCLLWADKDPVTTATLIFLSVAFARLWHVFNIRGNRSGLFFNRVTRNPFVWWALALCVLLLLGAVYIPPVAQVLEVVRLTGAEWGLVILTGFIPLILGQAALALGLVE